MSSDKSKKGKGKLPIGKRLGLALLIILAVLAITVVAVYRSLVVKPDLPNHHTQVPEQPSVSVTTPVEEQPSDEPVVSMEPVVNLRKSKDFYTILVAGTDTTSASTDTIMLVSYDVTNQKATVMSIPRDMLINAFGTDRYIRINTIYATYGRGNRGMDALTAEVAKLVGFTPDYRVFISWELVGQMVDAIGGVEFDVPFHMEYDDPAQDLHIYVDKGLQKLDGATAMQVVRWRKNNAGVSSGGGTGSDLDRVRVQQGFLKAVLTQTLQIKNVTRVNELAKLFGEHVEGDLTVENLLWFATQAVFGGLDVASVEFVTMPWRAANPYVYPDQEKLLELINGSLNPFTEDVTAEQLNLIYFDEEGNLCATSSTEN